mmetsp:Transcript_30926/g.42516  ORF Transcript_30926/g.42516 Transcript_30926/m.42516 type:complete len:85 (+) Transcript_30926:214-468(+)
MFEATDQTLNGPSSSITQRTDRVAFNRPRDLFQHGNLSLIAIAHLQSFQNALHPPSSFSAWSALATGFVFIEVRQPSDGGDHVH